jgi:hypothetical protein
LQQDRFETILSIAHKQQKTVNGEKRHSAAAKNGSKHWRDVLIVAD